MRIKLNRDMRLALSKRFAPNKAIDLLIPGDVFDLEFQHTVGDASGESTQMSVNGQWLWRDGTWHDRPEVMTGSGIEEEAPDPEGHVYSSRIDESCKET